MLHRVVHIGIRDIIGGVVIGGICKPSDTAGAAPRNGYCRIQQWKRLVLAQLCEVTTAIVVNHGRAVKRCRCAYVNSRTSLVQPTRHTQHLAQGVLYTWHHRLFYSRNRLVYPRDLERLICPRRLHRASNHTLPDRRRYNSQLRLLCLLLPLHRIPQLPPQNLPTRTLGYSLQIHHTTP
jgi:hypothetical protein